MSDDTLTITLPAATATALRAAVVQGGYDSPVDLIGALVDDWTRSHDEDDDTWGYSVDELRELIREGDESGPSIPAADVFAELRARFPAQD